jgi:hypothetical protein
LPLPLETGSLLDDLRCGAGNGLADPLKQLGDLLPVVGMHAIDQPELPPVVVRVLDAEEPPIGFVEVDQLAIAMDRDQVGHEIDHRTEAGIGLLVKLPGAPAQRSTLPPCEHCRDRTEADHRDEDHEPARLPPCRQDLEP